ncbi:nectin-1-like isoform X2 [Clupea harengus]|uniref:Nectin-1-like isoform X2 n=1 Tax=Clupea harengus TaxID=7950 RepID=A0A8M1KHK6_CLUHA|nr:nectin-1-like isoform X2 [Clupea harengus]
MDATGRMKRILLLLHILSISGMSSTTMVNISSSVGKDVSLPCAVNSNDTIVVQIQWQKQVGHHQEEQIVIYNPIHGEYKSPGDKGSLRAITNPSSGRPESFHLDLEDLELQDSALYVCDINTFPSGTSRQYVNLQVKGEEDRSTPAHLLTTEVPASLSSRPLERTTPYPTMSSMSSTTMVNISSSVGKDVSLPCAVNSNDTIVVQIQWQKQVGHDQEEQIVIYNPTHGEYKSPGHKGSLRAITNPSSGRPESFHLDLEDLELQDSALYACDINTFPSGTSRQYVNLQVKGEEDRSTPANLPTTTVPASLSPRTLERTTPNPTMSTPASGERYWPFFIRLATLTVLLITGLLCCRYLFQKRTPKERV